MKKTDVSFKSIEKLQGSPAHHIFVQAIMCDMELRTLFNELLNTSISVSILFQWFSFSYRIIVHIVYDQSRITVTTSENF